MFLFFYEIIPMTKIQQARINSHIDSLGNLEDDLPWILESAVTAEEIEHVKWTIYQLLWRRKK